MYDINYDGKYDIIVQTYDIIVHDIAYDINYDINYEIFWCHGPNNDIMVYIIYMISYMIWTMI